MVTVTPGLTPGSHRPDGATVAPAGTATTKIVTDTPCESVPLSLDGPEINYPVEH